MFLLFEQAGGAQKFTGPPREKPASGSATPQNTSDFRVKKVGFLFYFAPHRKKRAYLKPLYSGALVPGGHRSAPTEPAGETPGHSGKLTHTRAQRPVEARGRPLSPHGRERTRPAGKGPLPRPKRRKMSIEKKIRWHCMGCPKRAKSRTQKKISLPRYPPTLWRPKKAHRGPAWGSVSNSGGVIGQGEPLF